MTDAWQSFPGAPPPGTRLCATAEVAEPVTSFDLDGFPVLLVRSADGLRAYVNACPHQYLPLDWRASSILSRDGTILRCSNHDAGFDAATGQGIDGLGQGCELDAIPLIERDGALFLGGVE